MSSGGAFGGRANANTDIQANSVRSWRAKVMINSCMVVCKECKIPQILDYEE